MKKHNISIWPILALLFMGIGIGLLTDKVAAFALIGLGIGTLIAYTMPAKTK